MLIAEELVADRGDLGIPRSRVGAVIDERQRGGEEAAEPAGRSGVEVDGVVLQAVRDLGVQLAPAGERGEVDDPGRQSALALGPGLLADGAGQALAFASSSATANLTCKWEHSPTLGSVGSARGHDCRRTAQEMLKAPRGG